MSTDDKKKQAAWQQFQKELADLRVEQKKVLADFATRADKKKLTEIRTSINKLSE